MSAPRLFLANGVLRKVLMAGGWLPLSVRIVVDLEFSALQLLLMGTSMEIAMLIGEVPTGVVADIFSRKWSVIIGAVLIFGAQLASGIVDEWTFYLVTQFVWGIGWTFISGAEIAWVTDEVGSAEETEPLLLRRGRLEFGAVIVGIAIFGALSLVLPLAVGIIIAGATGLAWTVFLAVALTENGFVRSTRSRMESFVHTTREGARFTWNHKALRTLGYALIIGGMAAEALDRLPLRRLEDIGLSDQTSPALIFAVMMIAKSLLGALVLWRLQDRFTGSRVITGFSTLLALVGAGALAAAHIPVLAVAVLVLIAQGGLLNVTDPLINTWTNALAPADARATVHSFVGQTRNFGEIIGGISLGAVAALTTLPIAWTVAAALFGLSALVARRALPHWT